MKIIKSTRESFISGLIDLARKDEKIVLVSADSLAAMRGIPFMEEFPDRVFEVGISEQNSVGLAAGLAASGLKPYVCTYSGFLTMRACEQIRTFVAYPNLDVKIVGLNGGMLGGEKEGVTHQFYEDVAIMRAIPNMKIILPCDGHETYAATVATANLSGPVFLRIGSGKEYQVYEQPTSFDFNELKVIREYGKEVAVFASGLVMYRAIEAINYLKEKGVNCTLINVATLKPFNDQAVLEMIQNVRGVVTIEDHNVIGGLGSCVAKVMAKNGINKKLATVGLQDEFSSSGVPYELYNHYGLAVKDIEEAVKSIKN